jgi:RNA polymerase sigma factor (sigma-70 family)
MKRGCESGDGFMMQEQTVAELLSADNIERVYRYCYRRVNNSYDAEDLAQEILLEVLRATQTDLQPRNATAWLWGVARNRWRKYLERRQRSRQEVDFTEGGQVIDMTSLPDDDVENELINEENHWEQHSHRTTGKGLSGDCHSILPTRPHDCSDSSTFITPPGHFDILPRLKS